MLILGIHSGHDCGAALVLDGKILAAVNEERITRNKMAFGVPVNSVESVLKLAGVGIEDIDEIAIESIGKPDYLINNARPWFYKAYLSGGKGLWDFFYVNRAGKLTYIKGLQALAGNLLAMTGLPRFIMIELMNLLFVWRKFGFRKKVTLVPHHLAHLASAYFTAGKKEALSVVIEEFDGVNALSIDMVKDGEIFPVAASPYPHSPGVFYSLVTRMLGHNQFLHAGKITGLAAYGDPAKACHLVKPLMWNDEMEVRLSPLVYRLVAEYAETGRVPVYFNGFSPEDLAAAFQRRLEDTIVPIVELAVKKTGARDIVLSGGVAANVKLNERIHDIKGLESVFVHPGMSDCGTALGAALYAANVRRKIDPFFLGNVFLGHEITNSEVETELKKLGWKYSREENICEKIARILSEGKIVVRVRGKMEYGPRALGHRSILYHCKDIGINKWLNNRLRRTEYMPFAPAVLAEKVDQCFVNYRGSEYSAEFMTITFDCTEWMKTNCPAVVHVDNTARPQLIKKENNPDFYSIIEEYNKITGIPVLINTSYNIHNEPIVQSAADALRVFKLTCLDYIAINDILVSAKENGFIWSEGNL